MILIRTSNHKTSSFRSARNHDTKHQILSTRCARSCAKNVLLCHTIFTLTLCSKYYYCVSTDEKMSSKSQAQHWDLVELTSTMSTASQIHQCTNTDVFFSLDIYGFLPPSQNGLSSYPSNRILNSYLLKSFSQKCPAIKTAIHTQCFGNESQQQCWNTR